MWGEGDKAVALSRLRKLPHLRELVLLGGRLADRDLRSIGALTSLERLDLTGSGITDAGIEHLKGLTRLRRLYLFDTKVTGQGVGGLQRELPECGIGFGRQEIEN